MGVSVEALPERERALVKRVCEAFAEASPRHEAFRKRADRFYALYRSYRDLKTSYAEASPRDVDSVLEDARHGFGTDLFIPYVLSTIETTLPRMLSANPRLLVTPGDPKSEPNVENVRLMIDRQQSRQDYPLTLQDVGKSGLMTGLGVQKVMWEEKWQRGGKVLERATAPTRGGSEWVVGERDRLLYCGPKAEWVDPWDFIWDPYAHSIETCRYAIHRWWVSDDGVMERLKDKDWKLPKGVKKEDVLGQASDEKRSEIWTGRDAAAGNPSGGEQSGGKMHEVWEFHDGSDVIVVLDRSVPVASGPNPYWHGELPFQIFRPTKVPGEMVGIGMPESIEDLVEEMSTLRSQRRDNAAMAVQRPFAYFDGMVDVADFRWAAGAMIPVDGDPKDLIFPLQVGDVPQSGYQEEANLQRDIERVTGIDDTLSGGEGGGGASQTATGVQMVHAAANLRIQNQTRRLEIETVKRTSRQFLSLNQQHIIEDDVIVGPPKPGEVAHKAYSWYSIGPAELAGEFEIEPEGGSMTPPNPVEKMSKAQQIMQMFMPLAEAGLVKPEKVVEYALDNVGVENPRSWLAPQAITLSPEAVMLAAEALGIPGQEMVDAALAATEAMEEEQAETGALEQGGSEVPSEG
jgi:hypothetical protein